MAALATIGLLFSIVFHETAHSLVARHYGMPIRGITRFIFGGGAEMTAEPSRPRSCIDALYAEHLPCCQQ